MKRTTLAAIAAAIVIAVTTAVTGCSSSPSVPAWCKPLITQLHANGEDWQDYQTGLEASGAPVGQLVADINTYEGYLIAMNTPGMAGFTALATAPAALKVVGADLQKLNHECGQASGAYEADSVPAAN